ncbi:MAG: family 20 glycosylhydrolase [Bacteroidota bacterium]
MNRAHFFHLALAALLLQSCALGPREERSALPIIPRPIHAEAGSGVFRLDSTTAITAEGRDTAFLHIARMAADLLRHGTGLPLPVVSGPHGGSVIIFRQSSAVAQDEGYRLTATPSAVVVEARTGAGAFYGLQTLRQILPPDVEIAPRGRRVWSIPVAIVEDAPRYPYRGMHLDVGRHFFPVSFVKRYIDLLAMHKMNRFHWHLTEDQGWRIEIKRYPRLTEVGAWRRGTLIGHYSDMPHRFDSTRYGGFYTQDEIREVVRYAQERFVTIVPEIEMPGHSLAALSAYPELSCTGGPFEPAMTWGVFDDIYCTKDSVFTFLEGVLTEVMDLFPGTYIHIGGDEAPKTRWSVCAQCSTTKAREGLKDDHELQSYFIRRIERFLTLHGRKLIGWDEILEGGLAPEATVMSWRGTQGGIDAARQRHNVIMTPGSHCYFDHYQSRSPEEPVAIGGYTTMDKVYSYEPTPPELTPEEAEHVLGAQGNVWTEYMADGRHVEYMAYPRAIALAEVLWTQAELRDFDDFADRLARHASRLDRLGVNYASHLFDVRAAVGPADEGMTVSLSTRDSRASVRYTVDGTEPTVRSLRAHEPIQVTTDLDVRAAGFKDGARSTRVNRTRISMHAAAGKPIGLATPPQGSYAVGGRQALVNGIVASDDRYGDGEWLGWSGNDLEATIDLLRERPLSSVRLRFYSGVGQWIWLPRSVEVQTSGDGSTYRTAATWDTFDHATTAKVVPVDLDVQGSSARYVKVIARRYGPIPAGSPGAGNEAWLFVDEITVR